MIEIGFGIRFLIEEIRRCLKLFDQTPDASVDNFPKVTIQQTVALL